MEVKTYIGTLTVVQYGDLKPVWAVNPEDDPYKNIDIEIGDELVIIDNRNPPYQETVFHDTVTCIDPKHFDRVPLGFDESVTLLVFRKEIKFRAILTKIESPAVEKLFEFFR